MVSRSMEAGVCRPAQSPNKLTRFHSITKEEMLECLRLENCKSNSLWGLKYLASFPQDSVSGDVKNGELVTIRLTHPVRRAAAQEP